MAPCPRQPTHHELQDGDRGDLSVREAEQGGQCLIGYTSVYTQIRPGPLRRVHGLVEGADRHAYH